MSWRALRNYNALLANARYDASVPTEADPGSKHPALTPIMSVPLRSGDRLFFAYWAKTFEVRNGYPGRRDARLFVPAALVPKDPVLVDLLRGVVYALARLPEFSADAKTAIFSCLPVTDYPLVLTERASVEFAFDK